MTIWCRRSLNTWLFTVVQTPEGVEVYSPEGDAPRGLTINVFGSIPNYELLVGK